MLKLGFKELNYNEIYSFAVLENHSSRAVMQRLKMVKTEETFLHPDVPSPEHLREHCIYKISQVDWVKRFV